MSQRVIFHVDANSAFLSWSAAYRVKVLGESQDLRLVPSAVAGDKASRHSIILAKSTPAKKYGIQTGEPLFHALEKCPELVVIPPDYGVYVQASRHFVAMLREFSPSVEQYSIDEAWVDMTGTQRLWGPPRLAAELMRRRIWEELGFTVNIGISSNKLLAKMAGDFEKPNKVHTLFPEEIEKHKGFIQGFEADLETLAAHPHPEDGFAGMEIRGDVLTDKENAGAALLDACKEVKGSEPVQIGSYRGFTMSVEFSAWKQEYTLLLKGQMTHRASLGTDPRGNLTRIDNALAQMPQRLEAVKNQLDNLYQQQAAAKEEIGKPFPFEDDLRVKSARLVELDTLLNIDGKGHAQPETVVAKSARPSVLDSLKRPVPPRSPEKKPKQHEEVR